MVGLDEYLPLYKALSVPLYHYPTSRDFERIVEALGRGLPTKRALKDVLRERYRCYLSEVGIWRRLAERGADVDAEADPPSPPSPALVVVMYRRLRPDAEDVVRSLGLRPSVYSGASPACGGFYARSFEDAERAVDELGRRGAIADAMIVNATWTMRLGRSVNIFRLAESGVFVPSVRNRRIVVGRVGDAAVVVSASGVVYMAKAVTPEIAYSVARKVCGLVEKYGA